MNKEVSVKGMQLKAHSEEGLLINEVKAAGSNTWDNEAQAAETPTAHALRPASTYDLTTWWHANSKLSNDEAGIDNLASGTVSLGSGAYYKDISISSVTNYTAIDAENGSGTKAEGSKRAETHVYYSDASFGSGTGTYDDGEGFYVKYIYYLKSSGEEDLKVKNLQAQVRATRQNTDASGTSDELDKSLRVGIAIPASVDKPNNYAGTRIFAPVIGADDSYYVTKANTGESKQLVNPVDATTKGAFTAYTQINKGINGADANATDVVIPKVTSDGIPVYVYVWFEGEDQACMSDNLTAVLDEYQIDINFKDADLEGF